MTTTSTSTFVDRNPSPAAMKFPRIVVEGNLVINGNVYIGVPACPSGDASGSEDASSSNTSSEYCTSPRPQCTCTSSVCTSCTSSEGSNTVECEYCTCTCPQPHYHGDGFSSTSSGTLGSQDNVPRFFNWTPIPVLRARATPEVSSPPFFEAEDLLDLHPEGSPCPEASPAPEAGPASPPPRLGPLSRGFTSHELRTQPAPIEQPFELYHAHVSTTTFVVLIVWTSATPIDWQGETLRVMQHEFHCLRALNHTAQVLHGVIKAGKEICLYREAGNGEVDQFTHNGRSHFHEEDDLFILRQWRDRVPREKIEGVSDTDSDVSSPYRPRLSSSKFLNIREEDRDPR
ncbi:uncharacterized protein BO72DRAFT_500760 [Aspergillus fijiensis CBS 313.89]|uniref:Uncharacterized protein n=1 Tax=Aspergillus fijiensis CBS 313.89 TaxID=1448319 RepID=A0A8G1VU37_9EURO|nr:uncharacterized protein BO72DRAFT_500760 [Aspergillus fijiensis CBS 313.89]RAK72722.1 hypothetical protein BO72DRAFT_500760 [Aspergillus fijiensis CBS 313.89]